MDEEAITKRITYLNNLKAVANPQETKAIEGQIKQNEEALKELTSRRAEEDKARLESDKKAMELNHTSREDLVRSYSAKREIIDGLKPDINRLQYIINQPDYHGGPGNTPIRYIYWLGQAVNNIAHVVPGVGNVISRETMDKWAGGNSKAFMEEANAIMKGLALNSVRLLPGQASNKDLAFSQEQNANLDMSPTGVNRLLNRIRVEHARVDRAHKLVVDGVERGKSFAEIEGKLRALGNVPMFVDKEGNLTDQGRAVANPPKTTGAAPAEPVKAPAEAPAKPAGRTIPQPGDIEGGFRFKGGDWRDRKNWEQGS